MKTTLHIVIALGLLGALAGCEEETAEIPVERIRAIKPYFVIEPAGGSMRIYSGTVSATDTSALSFAVAGTVATVAVVQGDRVKEGQVLATLDPKPFELNVQAANSELASADARRTEKKNALDRQLTLYEKGWVAKAALDQAFASFDSAEAELNLARSRLGTSERELAKTHLTAPFDGLIAVRDVEPFEEVTPGTAALRINSEGALEIDLAVSDNVISRLAIGVPVNVDISTVTGCGCAGRITEIGTSSGSANLVPVTAALLNGPPDVLPGMSAEVSVMLSSGNGAHGFLVPISAIAPGDAAAPGYIFKFDTEARVVRKVAVRGGDGVVDNLVAIVEGVSAGDIVAAAGVSFLRDGQSVKLLGE